MSRPQTAFDETKAVVQSEPSSAEPTRGVSAPRSLGDRDHQANANIGRYIVIAPIGRGGMGVVLRAYDPRLHREVALKLVRADQLSKEARARMLREAQAMAKVSHPNVVGVYDVEVTGEDVVLAMEYVRGSTLREWLTAKHPWRDVVRMFVAAGHGLLAAHRHGMLHRDFKPENVLVGVDGRARVTDFGLARLHGERAAVLEHITANKASHDSAGATLTEVGTILGTPRYMAPEQYRYEDVLDARTDQYAFCVALWEALTGAPPFASGNIETDAEHKRQGPPSWPAAAACPVVIREAVLRGLAPAPDDRWASMEPLLGALGEATQHRHGSWWTLAVLGAGSAVAAVAMGAYRESLAQRCNGAASQLSEAWNPQRRDRVQQAFLATGVPYASETWQRVGPVVDDYAIAWVATHTQACEATTVRGEQPAAVMDLSMACLQRAKVELQAVTDLLLDADAQLVERAHQVVSRLPALQRCSDIEALQAEVAPPHPEDAETVESIEAALAALGAAREAGRSTEEETRGLLERVRLVPYTPMQVRVMEERGYALDSVGEYPRAEAIFKEGLRLAVASKQWQRAASISAALVFNLGWGQMRPAEALAFAEVTKGLLPHASDASRVYLHRNLGSVLDEIGKAVEAEAEHRACVALATQSHGPDSSLTAHCRGALGFNLLYQGRLDEAEHEQRMRLAANDELFGAEHPMTASAQYDLGYILYEQAKYAEASLWLQRAYQHERSARGPNHPNTIEFRITAAYPLVELGREAEAVAEFEATLPLKIALYGPEHIEIAFIRGTLGVALANLGRLAEAEAHLRVALALCERHSGPQHPRIARARSRVVMLLVQQGRYAEAEVEARRLLPTSAAREAVLGHGALGAVRNGQGRYTDAETEFRAALQAAAAQPANSPTIAGLRIGLGRSFVGQGLAAEAEVQFRLALTLQNEVFVPEHPSVALTNAALGIAVREQGRLAEAESLQREALASLLATRGAEHPALAELQWELGRTLLQRGARQEATAVLERARDRWGADERVPPSVRTGLATALARSR